MRKVILWALFLWLLCAACGDDLPSREETCAASCEERGGEFYMIDGEYCYCAWR